MLGEGLSRREKQQSRERALFERIKIHILKNQNPIDVIDAVINVAQNKEYKSPISKLLIQTKRELVLVLYGTEGGGQKEVLTEEDRLDQVDEIVTTNRAEALVSQIAFYELLAKKAEVLEKDLFTGKQRAREYVLAALQEAQKIQKDQAATFDELIKDLQQL